MAFRVDPRWDTIAMGAWHHWRIEELVLKHGLSDRTEFPTGAALDKQYNAWLKTKWGITVVDTGVLSAENAERCDEFYDFPSKEHAWLFYDFYKDKGMHYWEDLYNIYPAKKGMYEDIIGNNTFKIQVDIMRHLAPEGVVPVIPNWKHEHSGFDAWPNPPVEEIMYEV
jgi:hypothetical protein